MLLPALIVSLTLGQGYVVQRQGTDPLDAARETHVQALGKQLRCAVCQGVSIADSPASMARAQLDKVRELVAQGKTDEEIFEYFVDRYGEWALMEPRKSGVTLGLWLLPLLLLGVGLVIILRSSGKRGPLPTVASTEPAPAEPEADDAFLQQVRADLEK